MPYCWRGGRPKKLLAGSVSSGAEDDIKRATRLARSMVAGWGMSDAIGPIDLRQREEHPFLGQSIAQPREFSDTMAAHVDAEVAELLKEGGGPRHRDPVRPRAGAWQARLASRGTGDARFRGDPRSAGAGPEPAARGTGRGRNGRLGRSGAACVRPGAQEGLTARLVSPPCPKHAVGRTCHRAFSETPPRRRNP